MLAHGMLANANHSLKKVELDANKEKVYDRLVDYLESEGYPTEADVDFNETNVSDLVYCILASVVSDFRRKTGRNVRLTREKEIISTDNETGGREDFIVIDRISVTENRVVLVMEAKKGSTGEARKQCLLAMRDCWDNNDGMKEGNNDDAGVLYGFVTTGEDWAMIRYDGSTFEMTNQFTVMFETMGEEKERWLEGYYIVVDCMCCALSDGGMVKKD